MITGFNTEVKFKNTVYHVQTEDRGVKAARIDTIIYRSGGAIVHKKQVFYSDILACECLDQAVQEMMSEIHSRTTNEIQKGLWTLSEESIPAVSTRDTLRKFLLQPESATGLY
jgi:hypothetical protein